MGSSQENSRIPPLDEAEVDLKSLRDEARLAIVNCLDEVRGRKILVLDPTLSGPISLLVATDTIREHGGEELASFSYNYGALSPPESFRNICYFVRPTQENIQKLVHHVMEAEKQGHTREFAVFFWPRHDHYVDRILENEGVLGSFSILSDLPIEIIPLESDLISLESEKKLCKTLTEQDPSVLVETARALLKIQKRYGFATIIRGKGNSSERIFEILKRMRSENFSSLDDSGAHISKIESITLIDREVDLFTPQLTPLTYEGLIDVCYGIRHGACEFPAGVLSSNKNQSGVAVQRPQKIPLNGSDKIYKQIRDQNFSQVQHVLRTRAVEFQENYQSAKQARSQISDIKELTLKIKEMPELGRHIDIASSLMKFAKNRNFVRNLDIEQELIDQRSGDTEPLDEFEHMIWRQEDPETVLRLLVLYSLTRGGIPKRYYDNLRRDFLQSYGFHHLRSLNLLQAAGLLKRQEGRNLYLSLKKALRLVVEEVAESERPQDFDFIYGKQGYAPLSVRLMEHVITYGTWRGLEDSLRLLPGRHFEAKQDVDEHGAPIFLHFKEEEGIPKAALSKSRQENSKSLHLIVYVGGITSAEVSALRFLNDRIEDETGQSLLILTTELITAKSVLSSFCNNPSSAA